MKRKWIEVSEGDAERIVDITKIVGLHRSKGPNSDWYGFTMDAFPHMIYIDAASYYKLKSLLEI